MNFTYFEFALVIVLFSVFAGLFFSPNQTGVMNASRPTSAAPGRHERHLHELCPGAVHRHLLFDRDPGSGVDAAGAPGAGLIAQGVPAAQAQKVSHLPPIGSLFAAFLGYNPIQTEVPHQVLASLGPARASYLTGRTFFPTLISSSFQQGLRLAFDFAAVLTVFAAVASWLRGGKYVHGEQTLADEVGAGLLGAGEVASAEVGAGYME